MDIKRSVYFCLVMLVSLLSITSSVTAEIYKYKDEKGRWNFSDAPPGGGGGPVSYQSSSGADGFSDFQKTLQEKYNPKGPVESATLAVVTVKTAVGTGSGFLISDKCHIVTNKHVVRPTATKSWKETGREIKEKESYINKSKREISKEKKRLKINKKKLDQQRDYLDDLEPGEMKNDLAAQYQYRINDYKQDKKELEKKIKKIWQEEKEFKKKRSNYSMDSNIVKLSKTFKVILKDSTEVNAKLIELSKDEDLALLKVNQCKSPYLKLDKSVHPFQGMNVFAIGSPLGLTDYVTSGIVTNVDDDEINIDAKILPGNSGGPLITAEGDVIGVNTSKLSANSPNSEGFGRAIPVKMVIREFADYF